MSPKAIALATQQAAVLYGPKDIRIEQRTLWPPQHNQAQVAIKATGLCGSDLHYYLHGRNGDFAVQAPMVLGHEAAGIVTAVGAGVKNLRVGQRVAIEAGIMCNHCEYCIQGRYNLCKGMRFCSSAKTFPHLDGTLQERMNHPASVLHPLPDNCTYEQAALAEPLSVLLHASRRASLSRGQSVLVFGVGAIGILACALARSVGASRVVAIDINQARLDFAVRRGFVEGVYCLPSLSDKEKGSHTVSDKEKGSLAVSDKEKAKTTEEGLRRASENIAVALKEFKQEEGFDLVFECTGAEACIQMAVHAAKPGGKLMLIGMGSPNPTIPLSLAATREVDILGSFRYANTYPEALALLASGRLGGASGEMGSGKLGGVASGKLGSGELGGIEAASGSGKLGGVGIEALVTQRFELGECAEAFGVLARGRDAQGGVVLKVMIGPRGEA